MKFLSRLEVEEFLQRQRRSNEPTEFDAELKKLDEYCIHFKLLESPGRTLALRYLFKEVFECTWILAIVENAGVWPSWEDRNLYEMMRTAKHGPSNWSYGEGHLFDPSETADIISFVTVFTNFRWDYRVINSSNDFHLHVDHDDHGKLFKGNLTEEFYEKFSGFFT
jgi:hypothetical protein